MKFYPNPAEDHYLRKKILSRWGINRLFRDLHKKYEVYGKTIILSSIIKVAKSEDVFFPRRSIQRMMNKQGFTKDEKFSITKWIDSLTHKGKYVYSQEEKSALKQEKQKQVSKDVEGEK